MLKIYIQSELGEIYRFFLDSPLGVKNVKILENSGKIREPPGDP